MKNQKDKKVNDMTTISGRIKDIRIKNGLTQLAFADSLGIDAKTYGRYENTESFGIDTLMSISQTYDVSTDYILFGKKISPIYELERLLSGYSEEVQKICVEINRLILKLFTLYNK